MCKECGDGEVEDTEHFVMRCTYVVKEKKRLEKLMRSRVKGWHELGENKKVLRFIEARTGLQQGCTLDEIMHLELGLE